jgi:hypothetical protein
MTNLVRDDSDDEAQNLSPFTQKMTPMSPEITPKSTTSKRKRGISVSTLGLLSRLFY